MTLMNRNFGKGCSGAWCRSVLLTCLCLTTLGQSSSPGSSKGVTTIPEYDGVDPNKVRAVIRIRGATAKLTGQVPVEEFHREVYSLDGRTNLLISATNCVFDMRNHAAFSSDRVRVVSGDGRLLIEGLGFIWRQTNNTLVISNQVHTRLMGGTLTVPTRAP